MLKILCRFRYGYLKQLDLNQKFDHLGPNDTIEEDLNANGFGGNQRGGE